MHRQEFTASSKLVICMMRVLYEKSPADSLSCNKNKNHGERHFAFDEHSASWDKYHPNCPVLEMKKDSWRERHAFFDSSKRPQKRGRRYRTNNRPVTSADWGVNVIPRRQVLLLLSCNKEQAIQMSRDIAAPVALEKTSKLCGIMRLLQCEDEPAEH